MTREKMYGELIHYVCGNYLEKLTDIELHSLYLEILGGL